MTVRRSLFVFVLLAFALLGAIYLWSPVAESGRSSGGSSRGHSHSHSHGDLDPVQAGKPYPVLDVDLRREDDDRILELSAENFVFEAGGDSDPRFMTGHAHLFVDGESIAMFYTDRYVLPDFMPGTYRLKVTLNKAESHAPISVGGTVVSDTVVLTVEEGS